MSFATVLCLIPENIYGACKLRDTDWQLVARYFTVKSTDFVAVYDQGERIHTERNN